jgi:ribosomal protein L7Ae-like RNA K-turn-binding protein
MNKIFSMVGLATRAGKTVAGEFSVEKAVKEQKAKLVIVSQEASENTKKLFTDKCTYYKIPIFVYGSREELGNATGNQDRVSIAVLDTGFSKSIIKMLTDNQ